jgi:Transposase DDE domain group 1
VLDWCEANRIDYVFGLAPTSTWKRHVGALEASTLARFKADPSGGKVRRFKEFFDAANTWSRVRRIVARVEAGSEDTDTRFVVTNLAHGSGRSLYQDLYCRRGQAENHVWTPPAPQALSSS